MNNELVKRRPKLDVSFRIRARVWYYAVKDREKLSDYALGKKFAMVDDDEPEGATSSIRIFDPIRRNGALPSRGGHPKRKYDLVMRVEETKHYHGTAKIIDSPFWRLIEKPNLPLKDIRDIVVDCIKVLELAKKPGDEDDDGGNDLEDVVLYDPDMPVIEYLQLVKEGDRGYDEAMGNAFIHLPVSLDYIALIGALGLEAIYANNMQIAAHNIECFEILLREYCEQAWLSQIGDQLYNLSSSRMHDALVRDLLKGLDSYVDMLSQIPGANMNSHAVAFLKRHQRLLWRK